MNYPDLLRNFELSFLLLGLLPRLTARPTSMCKFQMNIRLLDPLMSVNLWGSLFEGEAYGKKPPQDEYKEYVIPIGPIELRGELADGLVAGLGVASRSGETPMRWQRVETCLSNPLRGALTLGPLPSFQQSWKCTKGFPKRKIVFQSSPVNFHDCWREGTFSQFLVKI